MFRLSNKIVQVNFQDHTEILLNSENRYVTYVNKKGERQTMPLNLALDSNNAEMTKRLKYTKDILTHMLNNNQQQTNTNTAAGNPISSSGSRVNTASDNAPNIPGLSSNSSRRAMPPQGLPGSGTPQMAMNGFNKAGPASVVSTESNQMSS